MKMFQLVLIVIGSFAAGFLLADGLAKSAPELVFVQSDPAAASTRAEAMECEVATQEVPVIDKQLQTTEQNLVTNRTVSKNQAQTDVAMALESYSALVASQQRPATELILQIEDADFAQMIEQQQQDQQFDAQSDLYQQQINEFMSAHPEVVQPQVLTCSSRFCLLELEVQNVAAWPALFKTLTAQQWWQSISYQSAAENTVKSEQQTTRITLLLQHDWVPVSEQQQLAVADGGQIN